MSAQDAMEENTTQRKRRKVFEESDMTDDARRRLRRTQRNLHQTIVQEDGREDDEDALEFLSRKRHENNSLFESVHFTREAVLDAENAHAIVSKTLQHVDRLVQVPRYDATKLAQKLRLKCSTGQGSNKQFNWGMLGRECCVCFNSVPTGTYFLAGCLDEEQEARARQVRKPRAKAQVEVVEEQQPEKVAASKREADNLSAAEKAMKDIRKKIEKTCKTKYLEVSQEVENGDPATKVAKLAHADELDGVHTLFNPKSFTQSVENIFHFSFLIKKAEAEIGVRSKDEADENKRAGLFVRAKTVDSEDGKMATQAVVSFTMRDWRRICKSHNLQEGMIPHRTGSRHAKK